MSWFKRKKECKKCKKLEKDIEFYKADYTKMLETGESLVKTVKIAEETVGILVAFLKFYAVWDEHIIELLRASDPHRKYGEGLATTYLKQIGEYRTKDGKTYGH